MANPNIVTCPANEWTLVAAGVINGIIHRMAQDASYLQTYRTANDAAPASSEEGVPLFDDSSTAEIAASNTIDVYVKAIGTTGSVRVDL